MAAKTSSVSYKSEISAETEQYQAALRTAPGNGVWLMGLGISLQAEKRNAEAIDAFQKARSTANLPSELQSFIDRRLQQLSR
jgi:MSHA biogenesis protein MshN